MDLLTPSQAFEDVRKPDGTVHKARGAAFLLLSLAAAGGAARVQYFGHVPGRSHNASFFFLMVGGQPVLSTVCEGRPMGQVGHNGHPTRNSVLSGLIKETGKCRRV